ncbi:hypothetical protein [Streptomyces cadmiisoli]|uniref:hypothetical protein n=1 Tax=Streptomyces cadmiisoli TaxID=2184053 RepID=UPI003D74B58C
MQLRHVHAVRDAAGQVAEGGRVRAVGDALPDLETPVLGRVGEEPPALSAQSGEETARART